VLVLLERKDEDFKVFLVPGTEQDPALVLPSGEQVATVSTALGSTPAIMFYHDGQLEVRLSWLRSDCIGEKCAVGTFYSVVVQKNGQKPKGTKAEVSLRFPQDVRPDARAIIAQVIERAL